MDLTPTILELAGIKHPGEGGTFRGRDVVGLRGKSWAGYFQTDSSQAEVNTLHGSDDPIAGWELFGRAALRKGKWKIVFIPAGPYGTGKWELFDLEQDPGETRDLADTEPERTKELLALWDEYVRETGVVWGEPLKFGGAQLDPKDVIGGDVVEDTKAWMQLKPRRKLDNPTVA
jgi:arylsulfatase A-like enzyme